MAKAIHTETAQRPKAADVLVNISEAAIDFRYFNRKVTLVDIGRVVIAASRVLRYDNVDERISVENAAVLALAKKRQLVG